MKHSAILLLLIAGLGACSLFAKKGPPVFVIFFSSGSVELSTEAHKVVDQAADAIRINKPASVTIAAGVLAGNNLKLAQPRFDAVRLALIADGVSTELIARAAIPDTDEKEVGGTGNQRVEIRLVPKAPP
jgi:outer membrane protein OmpA-like peptidoglycan-associated protein